MSVPVAPLGPLPSDKHRAVLEVCDAFRAVCFACRATATNPTGKMDPDEARRRLDRLRYALVPFPDRRLYPDPFVALNDGRVRLDFNTPPPPGLDLESPDPVVGATSVHDATVRLAGRVFDLLLVVKLYERIDPETGERSMVPNYPYGYEREVVDIINGTPVKSKVTGLVNLPETEHYTTLPWTADLWDRLHKLHAPELAAYAWSPAFNPHPGRLRAELEREAALVPDPPAGATPATAVQGGAAQRPAAADPAPVDFFDPHVQSEPPQAEVLNWLNTLSETWQVVTPATDGEEMALGMLIHAKGINVRGTLPGPGEVRLTVSGVRWQRLLHAATASTADKVRGAVLSFVWDVYCRNVPHRDGDPPASPVPAPPVPLQPAATRPARADPGPSSTAPPKPGDKAGHPPGESQSRGVPQEEAEIRVSNWLAKHAKDDPDAVTRDAVAAGTGVSTGGVSKTAAWRAFSNARKAGRKPKGREVPLTDPMLAVVPSDGEAPDELAALIEEQARDAAEDERQSTRRHGRRHGSS